MQPQVLVQVPGMRKILRLNFFHLKLSPHKPKEAIAALYRNTTLDNTQCDALVAGLRKD